MELLNGQSTARKVLLLKDSESEVLVLTSPRRSRRWSAELTGALRDCAARGLRVRILLESGELPAGGPLESLRAAGAEIRQAPRRISLVLRPFPVHSEVWVFDRRELISENERVFAGASRDREHASLRVECLLGEEAARGIASYLDRRWESEARYELAYSVRHKSYAFHSGQKAELEFYGCLLGAQREVTLCVPGGRVSRKVEGALHGALREGIRVAIYTNADRDDASGLRRLRRLSAAGAVVKICGHRLGSEAAVIDGDAVYMGSLPTSWHRWTRGSCPVLVMRDSPLAHNLLGALEAQVSVEIPGSFQPAALR